MGAKGPSAFALFPSHLYPVEMAQLFCFVIGPVKMIQLFCLVVGSCLINSILAEHGEYFINLDHKIGDGDWIQRATLILPTIKQSAIPSQNQPQYIPMSGNERIDEIKRYATHNETLYRLRVPNKVVEEGEAEEAVHYVSTVIRLCALIESDLHHSLSVNMDNTGYVTGLTVLTSVSECVGRATTSATSFTVESKVSYPMIGALPGVDAYVEQKQKEEARKKEEAKDNRSFLAKYWMYILPVALIMMMNVGAQ